MINSAQAPEKRESAPKGQGEEHHQCQVKCSNRGSAGPSEKVATPATECKVELLEGRRIVSNEKERGRPSPRHQALAW